KYFDIYDTNDMGDYFINPDFYRYYECDLSGLSNKDAEEHWIKHGKNEFHRVHNPCKIKHFGENSWFIAGTCFASNKQFIEIFKDLNLDFEFDLLEDGYHINDVPKRTHAWEYLYGLLVCCSGGNVISVNNQGSMQSLT